MIQVIAAILTILMFAFLVMGVIKSKRVKDKQDELSKVAEDEAVFDIEEQIVDRGLALEERKKELKSKQEKVKDVK